MDAESAFLEGLRLVQEAGLPAKGNDIAVIAAHNVFIRACSGKTHDPRFAEQAPAYAKLLILRAFAA